MKRVLIIGGYGNFGSYISDRLARDSDIQLIIAGRSGSKAESLANSLDSAHRSETIEMDIERNFDKTLNQVNPDIVIHTSGPFQTQGYQVAKACIEFGCHYLDLADGRHFVEGIEALDDAAKDKGVLVISGASSVPCLSAAIIDHYLPEFDQLETLDYGITTAQKTNRGLATTSAILGYVGKPFTTLIDGNRSDIYGWQDLHSRRYRKLGKRMLGNCDIPDLALFPKRYPDLKTIRFYAGFEIKFIHLGLWAISGLVRSGAIWHLQRLAPLLLRISFLFDWAGSDNSGFHMELLGIGTNGKRKQITFELTARQGHGPLIPCMPAILLTCKLVDGSLEQAGAYPCVGFITRDEYLEGLGDLDITWEEYR